MGRWTTLHLFDDKIFKEKIIPELKGQKGDLSEIYFQFLKSHRIGGIEHYTTDEIQTIIKNELQIIHIESNKFDSEFENHTIFNKMNFEEQRIFLNENDWCYDFSHFFEYLVFNSCADFYPHLPCGKSGIHLNADNYELAIELISKLDGMLGYSLFSPFGMGIVSWLTSEEIELLYYDKKGLKTENEYFLNGFLCLLEIAFENKLGLIFGCDMRENILKNLPKSKLIDNKKWEKFNTQSLIFDKN